MQKNRERNCTLLKLLVIITGAVGLFFFEKEVFYLDYNYILTKVLALIFGFWVYIYSVSSLLSGIMCLVCFQEEAEGKIDWQAIGLFVLLIAIAITIQIIFWAIVLEYKFAWHIFFGAIGVSVILFLCFRAKNS